MSNTPEAGVAETGGAAAQGDGGGGGGSGGSPRVKPTAKSQPSTPQRRRFASPPAAAASPSSGRRARMDGAAPISRSQYATPRSTSWTRPKSVPAPRSQSARPPRSSSAHRLREDEEKEEKEKRLAAEAAFLGWLKRKQQMPRQPRASPSREQIVQYNKEDARQKVLNQWLAKTTAKPVENGHANGNGGMNINSEH